MEAALRGGVGRVTYLGVNELITELSAKYPEAVYNLLETEDGISKDEVKLTRALDAKHSATLIGSGSDNTAMLLELTLLLLKSEGSTLILDADSINALASLGDEGIRAIKEAKRHVILTPHPLEFARLISTDVATVQLNRLELAKKFAKETGAILVLKGASTIITNGENVYINVSGSSALAKAGSGDVLAGLIGAMCAQAAVAKKPMKPEIAATLAVYLHGAAGDALKNELSSYGVTPSDLPKKFASELAYIEKTDISEL